MSFGLKPCLGGGGPPPEPIFLRWWDLSLAFGRWLAMDELGLCGIRRYSRVPTREVGKRKEKTFKKKKYKGDGKKWRNNLLGESLYAVERENSSKGRG